MKENHNTCFASISSIGKSLPSNKFLKLVDSLDCHQSAIITQLQTGHILLNHHLFHIRCAKTPICPHCRNLIVKNVNISSSHVHITNMNNTYSDASSREQLTPSHICYLTPQPSNHSSSSYPQQAVSTYNSNRIDKYLPILLIGSPASPCRLPPLNSPSSPPTNPLPPPIACQSCP